MTATEISFFANHLWQSSVFTLVIAAFALALRNHRADIRHKLWLAASLKFLIPLSILVSLGSRLPLPVSPALVPADAISITDGISEPFATAMENAASPADYAIHLPRVLLYVWFVGVAVVLFGWLKQWQRVQLLLRNAIPLDLGLAIPAMSCAGNAPPGVFGIIRPAMLVPEKIRNELSTDQFRAVLEHEMCHVRRRDNFTTALHMIVEAIFWFHPFVWWIERRLIAEQEYACDEEVLRRGNEARVYAEGILKVCRITVQSTFVLAAGIGSSNLNRRIRQILINRPIPILNFGQKLILATLGVSVVVLPVFSGSLAARGGWVQSPIPRAERYFEVASIKVNKSGNARSFGGVHPGGRYSATNVTLRTMIESSYFLPSNRVIGGPDWMDSDHFDVEAKAEAGAIPPGTPLKETWWMTWQMVQNLLADQFKLKTHLDAKEMPIYVLTVAKGGSRLQAAPPRDCSANGSYCHGMSGGPRRLLGQSLDTADIADVLVRFLDRPVRDQTGLTGLYDIELHWTPASLRGTTPPTDVTDTNPREPALDPNGPDLFTAVQEQLGLKLEPARGPIEILVVESAERPKPQ